MSGEHSWAQVVYHKRNCIEEVSHNYNELAFYPDMNQYIRPGRLPFQKSIFLCNL